MATEPPEISSSSSSPSQTFLIPTSQLLWYIAHHGMHPQAIVLWKNLLKRLSSEATVLLGALEALVAIPIPGAKMLVGEYIMHPTITSITDPSLKQRKALVEQQVTCLSDHQLDQWQQLPKDVKMLVASYANAKLVSGVPKRRNTSGGARIEVTLASLEVQATILKICDQAQSILNRRAVSASHQQLPLFGIEPYLFILHEALGRALQKHSLVLSRQVCLLLLQIYAKRYRELCSESAQPSFPLDASDNRIQARSIWYRLLSDLRALVEGEIIVLDHQNSDNVLIMASIITESWGPDFEVKTPQDAARLARMHLLENLATIPNWTSFPPPSITSMLLDLEMIENGDDMGKTTEANDALIKVCMQQWKEAIATLGEASTTHVADDFHGMWKLNFENEVKRLQNLRSCLATNPDDQALQQQVIQQTTKAKDILMDELEIPSLQKHLGAIMDAMTAWYEVFGDIDMSRAVFSKAQHRLYANSSAVQDLLKHMAKIASDKSRADASLASQSGSSLAPSSEENLKKRARSDMAGGGAVDAGAGSFGVPPAKVPRTGNDAPDVRYHIREFKPRPPHAPALPQHDASFHLSANLVNALLPSQMALSNAAPTSSAPPASITSPRSANASNVIVIDLDEEPSVTPSEANDQGGNQVGHTNFNVMDTSAAPNSSSSRIENLTSSATESTAMSALELAQKSFLARKKGKLLGAASETPSPEPRSPAPEMEPITSVDASDQVPLQLTDDQRQKLDQLLKQQDQLFGLINQLRDSQLKSESTLEKEKSLLRAKHQQSRATMAARHQTQMTTLGLTAIQFQALLAKNNVEVATLEAQIKQDMIDFEAKRASELLQKQTTQQQILQAYGVPGFMQTSDPRHLALQKHVLEIIEAESSKWAKGNPSKVASVPSTPSGLPVIGSTPQQPNSIQHIPTNQDSRYIFPESQNHRNSPVSHFPPQQPLYQPAQANNQPTSSSNQQDLLRTLNDLKAQLARNNAVSAVLNAANASAFKPQTQMVNAHAPPQSRPVSDSEVLQDLQRQLAAVEQRQVTQAQALPPQLPNHHPAPAVQMPPPAPYGSLPYNPPMVAPPVYTPYSPAPGQYPPPYSAYPPYGHPQPPQMAPYQPRYMPPSAYGQQNRYPPYR
jgi:hypothetical protein